jgi:FKBP-type peptidyl-prolyl cis-trans isomerase
MPTELKITDSVVGTGTTAQAGMTVFVHYTGTLTNGQVFDSSIPRGEPFSFELGGGQVIQGWDIGIQGMKVGGKRTLLIPASLAYGDRETGPIPANSILIFEVELLDVKGAK